MKVNKPGKEILIWIIALAPLVYLGLSWNQLPDQVPIHFDLQGEANGWGSKLALAGLVFSTTVLMNLLLLFIPVLDPKGKVEKMGSKWPQMRLWIILMMAALASFVIYNAQHQHEFNLNLPLILSGVLILVLGNYFPALKPNYFIGIRTPWTLESESVWKKTHRLGGPLWVGGGALLVVASFLPHNTLRMAVFITTIALIVLIPTVFSFTELRKERQANF